MEWDATEDLRSRLVADGWSDRGEPRAAQVIEIRPQRPQTVPAQVRDYPVIPADGADPRVADWPDTFGWQLDDRFGSAALRSDWQLTERLRFTGIANQLRVESGGSKIPQSGFNFNAAERIFTAHIETSALELRLAGTSGEDDSINWLVGGNATKDRGFVNQFQILDSTSALFPDPVTQHSTLADRLGLNARVSIRQTAGFLDAGWKFADAFKLSGGARYTRQTSDYSACSFVSPESRTDGLSPLFTTLSASNAAQYTQRTGQPGRPSVITTGDCFTLAEDGSNEAFVGELDEANASYRLALDWQPFDLALLYVSAGRGFKAGGFPVLGATSQLQYSPVVQEELAAYETGAKLTVLDNQLRGNAAIYWYEYRNKQLLTKIRDPIFGPIAILQNAPESKVYGAELDVQYAPAYFEGLFLSGTTAYAHTEIEEFVGLNFRGESFDFEGRPFNFAPRLQWTLLANYTRPVTTAVNLTAGVDYFHSGATSSVLDGDPPFAHDAYGILGAFMGITAADAHWTVTAYARNLTNELYTIGVFNTGDSIARYVGNPLSYGLSLSYRWW